MGLVSLVEYASEHNATYNRHCETPLSLAHRTCEKKNGRPKESSLSSLENLVCGDDDVMNKDDVVYCSQMI